MKLPLPPYSNYTKFTKITYLQTISPHTPTYLNNLLNSTIETKNPKLASQIHTQLITNNLISLPFLFNNLLNFYAKSDQLNQSLLLFSTANDESKSIVTWTSLIAHFSHFKRPFEAISYFNQMRLYDIFPNKFTFSAVLPACADTMIIIHGEQIHSLIHKHGFGTDVFVCSALVDMYAKCCDMKLAEKVFDEMPDRNPVSWNSMIVGCVRNKVYDSAIGIFIKSLKESLIIPDQVSFSSVLSACANTSRSQFGKQVHGVAVKHGLVNLVCVKNALLDMYSKCGLFDEFVNLFQSIGRVKDVVTWNIMIMGYVHNDKFEDACYNFWVMRREGIVPDEASYSSVLHACASFAALNHGSLIHSQIIKTGFMTNTCVASSLITMYAKCGSLIDSYQVFDHIKDRNVICWTAIIAACQQHGHANQVLELFEKMLGQGIKPNHITFVSVLSACSHSGRVNEGFAYFDSMTKAHGIEPGHEHYACIVDLLGRAGRLNDAKKFIESMPVKPDSSVWGALLGACKNHGDIEIGKEVALRLFELEPDNPGNYVLLSNMFMRKGMLEEADEVRRLMGVNGVRKEPGCSWIDVKNTIHVLTVHDKSHLKTEEIYEMLKKMEE